MQDALLGWQFRYLQEPSGRFRCLLGFRTEYTPPSWTRCSSTSPIEGHAQKRKYHGELFISSLPADSGLTFLDFFQRDKATGNPKGIIAIDLESFP